MDLSVSPDVDAYYCYAIVILLGAITAGVQVSHRLGDREGAWAVPQTWLLFFLYLVVPIALFWFFDRTSAITDTSIFAALLVGVGYVGIMSGSNQTLRLTGDLSQIWTPFLAYADHVSQLILSRATRNQTRLIDRIIFSIIEENDRYQALESLAMRFSADPPALRAQLDQITNAQGRTPHEKLEDKTRILLAQLAAVPDVYYYMTQRGILDKWFYWYYFKGLRALIAPVIAIAVLAILAAIIIHNYKPNPGTLRADYYIWRLVKTNSTNLDQYRARYNLSDLMRDPKVEQPATQQLVTILRQPGLPIERVDLVLQTLLESHAKQGGNPMLPLLLVQSLRSGSVDVRTRINEALKYLQLGCTTHFDEGPNPWKPSDGDSTTLLETHIKKWGDFWAKPCTP